MSKTYDSLKNAEAKEYMAESIALKELNETPGVETADSWFLRVEDGSIYGPLNIHLLKHWAAEGRIAPGNMVSSDKAKWFPPESIRDLGMEWSAQYPDGRVYGPFNLLALPRLVSKGKVEMTASLINQVTGKTTALQAILKKRSSDDMEGASSELAKEWEARYHSEKKARLTREIELSGLLSNLSQEFQDKTRDLIEARDRLSSLESANKDGDDVYHKRLRELTSKSEQLEAEHKTLSERLEHAESHAASVTAQLEEVQGLLKKATARKQEGNADSAQTAVALQNALEEMGALRARNSETEKRAEDQATLAATLRAQLETLGKQIEDAEANTAVVQADAASRQKNLSLEISQLQKTVEEQAHQLTEAQSLHVDLQNQAETRNAALTEEMQKVKDLIDHAQKEIQQLHNRSEKQKLELDAADKRAEDSAGQLAAAEESAGKQNALLEQARKDLEATRQECEQLKTGHSNAARELEKTRSALDEQVADLEKKVAERDATVVKLERTHERDASRHAELKRQFGQKEAGMMQHIAQLEKVLDATQKDAAATIVDLETHKELCKDIAAAANEQELELRKELEHFQNQSDTEARRLNEIDLELKTTKRQLQEYRATHGELVDGASLREKEFTARIAELQSNATEHAAQLAEAQKHLEEAKVLETTLKQSSGEKEALLKREMQQLKKVIDEARLDIQRASKEAAEHKARCNKLTQAAQQKEKELTSQLAGTEKLLESAKAELETQKVAHEEAVDTGTQKEQQLVAQIAEMQRASDEQASTIAAIEEQLKQERAQHTQFQEQATMKETDLRRQAEEAAGGVAAMKKVSDKREAGLVGRMKELEGQLKTATAQLASSNTLLAESENKAADSAALAADLDLKVKQLENQSVIKGDQLAAAAEQAHDAAEQLQAARQDSAQREQELHKQLTQDREMLEALRTELEQQKAGHAKAVDTIGDKEKDFGARIAEMQKATDELVSNLAAAEEQLEQEKAGQAELQKKLKTAEVELDRQTEQLGKQAEDALAKLEAAQQAAAAQEKELNAQLEQAKKQDARAADRIKTLEGQSAQSTVELQAAADRLRAAQESLKAEKKKVAGLSRKSRKTDAPPGGDEPPKPSQWYLKIDDSVYGPVETPEFMDWVQQCRVAPEDQVSNDSLSWSEAHLIPDLEMVWTAELPDGSTSGPYNLAAISVLLEDGSVSADAVFSTPDGERTFSSADLRNPVVSVVARELGLLRRDNIRLSAEFEKLKNDNVQLLKEIEHLKAGVPGKASDQATAKMPVMPPKSVNQQLHRLRTSS